jgi:hypothetical protein
MADARQLIKDYLDGQHMMQLATVSGGQPWCCTVYFVTDADYNLYWASLPTRRHSREIAAHPSVAAAVPVKFVKGQPVAGLQLAGTAAEVALGASSTGPASPDHATPDFPEPSPALRAVVERYAATFARDPAWTADFLAARTAHRLYRFTPTQYVLFDESNFPAPEARWEFSAL